MNLCLDGCRGYSVTDNEDVIVVKTLSFYFVWVVMDDGFVGSRFAGSWAR